MLESLSIRDFVIVEKLDLEFFPGFTALTGETGAGKSILIDALQLLFGGRSDVELIRQGCEKSDLTATFSLSEPVKKWLGERELLTDPSDLVIRRTLDIKGKSRSWINGIPCSISQLRELSTFLVVVHGQHAHQSLLSKSSQLDILDRYGKLTTKAAEVKQAWKLWQDIRQKLEEARNQQTSSQEELQRLNWFIEDISELEPKDGEWKEINEEHAKLSRYTDIIDACQFSRQLLSEQDTNALYLVDEAISALSNVSEVDPKLEKLQSSLVEAREIIDSASADVEHYLDRTDFDEERFAELDQRLSLFLELSRKYHLEPDDLHSHWQTALSRISEIKELSNLDALFEKDQAAKAEYEKLSASLSQARKRTALKMQRKITDVMQTLAMEGGSFEIEIKKLDHQGPNGIDGCEFLVAGHAGVARRSLSKVASGGELARISLAISVTDTASATVDTLIFDEVDSGIGGAVAETVGQLLAELGQRQQVLCVTHLPQVASCADHHLKIIKSSTADNIPPVSTVEQLSKEKRVEEIARMLGGITITQKTKAAAEEMLKSKKKPAAS